MALLINRFSSDGLYILDEPEAALSPNRQMAVIARIHQLVQERCQFIIATHSPILMAYPQAEIFLINQKGLKRVDYEETEHYQVTKSFMNNYAKLLKILLEGEG